MGAVKCRAERCDRPAGKDGLCPTHRWLLACKNSGEPFNIVPASMGKLEVTPVGKITGAPMGELKRSPDRS